MGRRAAPSPESPKESDKPLPETQQRPGTSGTENLLMTTRREASEQFQKAQRAEKSYRSKKRATAARANFREAKGHFKDSASHLKSGVAMTWGAVRAAPYIWSQKSDERKRARTAAKKKKLQEELARENGEEGDAEKPDKTS